MRRRSAYSGTLVAILVAVLAAVGCGKPDGKPDAGADTGDATTDRTRAQVNGWRIAVDPSTGRWNVSAPGGATVLRSTADGPPVRVATGELNVEWRYGAFRIDMTDGSGLSWRRPAGRTPTLRRRDGRVSLEWRLESSRRDAGAVEDVRLTFEAADGDDLRARLRSPGADAGEIALQCRSKESFFGLGTQVTGLDLRGRTYPLWTQEQGVGKPEDGGVFPLNRPPEVAYAPMGVWHSSAGYSAILGHDSYAELEICSNDRGLRLRSHRRLPALTLDLEGTPRERVERVTHYTGRLDDRPPPWVFGPWVTAVGGPWRLDEVARTVRQQDLSVSAIWTEDWIGWWGSGVSQVLTYAWEWDSEHYPMLPNRVESLHDNGFAFLAYFNPFVPKPTGMWNEGRENGYLLHDDDGEMVSFQDFVGRRASLVDLSDPDAVDWLQSYQKRAVTRVGVDGWMADFAEWYPPDAEPETDVSNWEYHNRYPLEWARANRGSLRQVRSGSADGAERVFFTRSGWASTNGGSSGIPPAMWCGDQETDWTRTDGLPSVVPIVSHAGLAGVGIMGSDIGGYSSGLADPRSKRLFVRWTEMAAFHPLMRTHHGNKECKNWSFDRDQETLEHFERYTSIHTLLYPYLSGLLDEVVDFGVPATRHPWLVEPDHPELWNGEDWSFFLGDDLLVAPVLEKGSTERTVDLPAAGWWPLFGQSPVEDRGRRVGDVRRIRAQAPLTEIPVFVRPGTALPLLETPVDTLYGASQSGVTDLTDVRNSYRVALYPDREGRFELDALDGIRISGDGFDAVPNLGRVEVSGPQGALPSCDAAPPTRSCVDATAGLIRLRGVGNLQLGVGSGSIALEADRNIDLAIGFGGDAWGKWAEPTTIDQPAGSAPSYCEDAPGE